MSNRSSRGTAPYTDALDYGFNLALTGGEEDSASDKSFSFSHGRRLNGWEGSFGSVDPLGARMKFAPPEAPVKAARNPYQL